jgi:hypothetical protein
MGRSEDRRLDRASAFCMYWARNQNNARLRPFHVYSSAPSTAEKVICQIAFKLYVRTSSVDSGRVSNAIGPPSDTYMGDKTTSSATTGTRREWLCSHSCSLLSSSVVLISGSHLHLLCFTVTACPILCSCSSAIHTMTC